jgi:hypothetical protein
MSDEDAANTDLAHFAEAFHAEFCKLRDTKADSKDQRKLAEALNQSCRDLTSTLRVHRQDLAQLEQKGVEMARTVHENREQVADLGMFLAKRDEELTDLERRWSKRLWGYTENSAGASRSRPQSASRRVQPQSGGCAAPAEAGNDPAENAGARAALTPWKYWKHSGGLAPTVLAPTGLAPTAPKSPRKPCQVESLAQRLWESGPEALGGPPFRQLCSANDACTWAPRGTNTAPSQ